MKFQTISGAYCACTTRHPREVGTDCPSCGELIQFGYFAFADALEKAEVRISDARRDLHYRSMEVKRIKERAQNAEAQLRAAKNDSSANPHNAPHAIVAIKIAMDMLADDDVEGAWAELRSFMDTVPKGEDDA